MTLNRCEFIGNLGSDPEVRHTQSNQAVCNFRIACNEKWNDKDGNPQERTEWVRVVCWGKLAENCGKYLVKGRQVFVEGKMQTREWVDKEQNKRWTTEIIAFGVQFLGSNDGQSGGGQRSEGGGYGGGSQQRPTNPNSDGPPPLSDDDIPF